MAEKIKVISGSTINEDAILDILIKGATDDNEKKFIVLFPDSRTKQIISNSIGERLKKEPTFVIDKQRALTIKNNMLRAHNTTLFLGLAVDEPLLVSNYSAEQIKYYDKGEN